MKGFIRYEIKSQSEFEEQILQNGIVPSIVTFGADWSGDSQFLLGVIENALEDLGEELQFYHIETEENPEIVDTMRIRSIPTTFIFHHGEIIDYFTGLVSRKQMISRLKKTLKIDNQFSSMD